MLSLTLVAVVLLIVLTKYSTPFMPIFSELILSQRIDAASTRDELEQLFGEVLENSELPSDVKIDYTNRISAKLR